MQDERGDGSVEAHVVERERAAQPIDDRDGDRSARRGPLGALAQESSGSTATISLTDGGWVLEVDPLPAPSSTLWALWRSSPERSVWTTAHGKRIVGRGPIHTFTERVLPGAMRESLERVPEGRPTYVLTREGDEWLIAAAQNTQVKEP